MYNRYKQDTMIFWKGSIQKDRSARFTGKPYDEDLQAYVFPNRTYDPEIKRWRSMDPSGYPDGINAQFYAVIPTIGVDPLGLKTYYIGGFFEFDGPYHPMTNATCSKCGAPLTNQNDFRSWDTYDDILADIAATKQANPDEPINLVGHSYGGDTAYLMARDSNYTIDNLVTLDPVSHFTFDVSKPNNVTNWDNVYSNPNNYSNQDFDWRKAYANLSKKEQHKIMKEVQKEANAEYRKQYEDYFRSLGFKIKHKWTFKDFLTVILVIGALAIIVGVLWLIPPTHEYMLNLYNTNLIVRIFTDVVIGIFQGFVRFFQNFTKF